MSPTPLKPTVLTGEPVVGAMTFEFFSPGMSAILANAGLAGLLLAYAATTALFLGRLRDAEVDRVQNAPPTGPFARTRPSACSAWAGVTSISCVTTCQVLRAWALLYEENHDGLMP